MRGTLDARARGQWRGIREILERPRSLLDLPVAGNTRDHAVAARTASEMAMLRRREGAVTVPRTRRTVGLKIGLLSYCTPDVLDVWAKLPWAGPFE